MLKEVVFRRVELVVGRLDSEVPSQALLRLPVAQVRYLLVCLDGYTKMCAFFRFRRFWPLQKIIYIISNVIAYFIKKNISV